MSAATDALETVFDELTQLSREEQEHFAHPIRRKLEAEEAWERAFADPRSPEALSAMAREARGATAGAARCSQRAATTQNQRGPGHERSEILRARGAHTARRWEHSDRVLLGCNRLFEEQICAKLPEGVAPHAFVAIDVETGDFELGESDVGAIDRLIERTPDAEGRICLRRVGSETTYRMGRRFAPESTASSSP